jgi:putative sigma-54 modulation protein
MNFEITSVGFSMTPANEAYFRERFERIKRHFDQVISVSVILTFEKSTEKHLRQGAAVTLCAKGQKFFVRQRDANLYAAIDLLISRLDRQVVEYKDRLVNRERAARSAQEDITVPVSMY